MVEPWVINASPIILLAKVGLVHLLPMLAEPLIIPGPVADEIRRGAGDDAGLQWLNGVEVQYVKPPVDEPPQLSGIGIGRGERAVIAWAVVHRGFVAVLDDSAARVLAEQLRVPVLGTVGVLLRAKSAGFVGKVQPQLIELRRHGGHLSDALFHEALRRAGEE